jgi:hypothetical protein
VHRRAVGYATIDVVGACTPSIPTDEAYFKDEIRFDNVLIGDYQQSNTAQQHAQGNPLVHIRAIPEGGTPATRARQSTRYQVNFNRTFYDRYQRTNRKADARQPLPSLFAARWVSGGPAKFRTDLKIWRELKTTATTTCREYRTHGQAVGTEQVRFDEAENMESVTSEVFVTPIVPPPVFPATSRLDIDAQDQFAPNTMGAVGGWIYMNMDSRNEPGNPPASQNWIVVSMGAQGIYSLDFDAAALGNGCTPETDESEAVGGVTPLGPAPNFNPRMPVP